MSIFAGHFFIRDGNCCYLLLSSVFVEDIVDEGDERGGWGFATGGSLVSLARLALPELTGRSTGAAVLTVSLLESEHCSGAHDFSFFATVFSSALKVQKTLLQADVQSKSDKSPVTVADYGSQGVVTVVLQKELGSASFSLVAKEVMFELLAV
uniref:Uncharacterized protein n=1 Tax=Solanum tuberosum TaxID=4113 RepID=M1CXZ5_SOLTU